MSPLRQGLERRQDVFPHLCETQAFGLAKGGVYVNNIGREAA